MVALLIAMSIMGIMMSVALPAWQTMARREKEAELVFRGEQYARAIAAYQQKYGGTNPPNVDVLVTERFLRKKYKDPITNEDFVLIDPTTPLPGRAVPPGLAGGRATTSGGRTTGASGSRSSVASTASRGSTTTASRGSTGTTSSVRGTSSLQTTRTTTQGQGGRGGGMRGGGTLGIMGVMSKSTEKSLRLYNGAEHYNEWIFMGTQAANRAGAPTGGEAGVSGARGQPARGRGGATTQQGGRGTSSSTTRGQSRSTFATPRR
jgi:type II secretory pathway pseudopilin PulG